MKTFPDTPCYLVSYWPGTSGTFMRLLLGVQLGVYHVKQVLPLITEFGGIDAGSKQFDEIGDINIKHVLYTGIEEDSTAPLIPYHSLYDLFKYPAVYMRSEPKNSNQPLLLQDHKQPNHRLLFMKFPKAKNLIIQHDVEVKHILTANMFYKFCCDGYNKKYEKALNYWEKDKSKNFLGAKTPFDVPQEVLMRYFKSASPIALSGAPPYQKDSVITTDPIFNGQVYTLYYGDLLFNKQKTFGVIEEMTEKPVNANTIQCYSKYIQAQEFILEMCKHNICSDNIPTPQLP